MLPSSHKHQRGTSLSRILALFTTLLFPEAHGADALGTLHTDIPAWTHTGTWGNADGVGYADIYSPSSLGRLEPHGSHTWTPIQFEAPSPCSDLARLFYPSAHSRILGSGLSRWFASGGLPAPPLCATRVGEANHPGPSLTIGAANPSEVIGKADYLMDLPYGIWNIAETHLAAPSMRFQARARDQQRHLRLLFGAPVPLQPRSSTAGVWAGVMQFSNMPAAPYKLSWPDSQYSLGRVQVSQFRCGKHTITGANLYGWPSSPSWPLACAHTNTLIDHLTHERQGLRFVAGDFNASEDKLAAIHIWKQCGWVEAQELHHQLTGQPPSPTYRGQTRPDQLYLSPELAGYFRACQVKQDFADHATIRADFILPDSLSATLLQTLGKPQLRATNFLLCPTAPLPTPSNTSGAKSRTMPAPPSMHTDYLHSLLPAWTTAQTHQAPHSATLGPP